MLFKHQPWNGPETASAPLSELEWNMWRSRQWPYSEIESGQLVMTVSHGGPARGRVINEVLAHDLVKGPYRSKQHAWEMILYSVGEEVLWDLGFDEDAFLEHPYTQDAPSEGFLLAWWGVPMRIIDAPRPAELKFRQNGWGELSDDGASHLYENAVEVVEEELD